MSKPCFTIFGFGKHRSRRRSRRRSIRSIRSRRRLSKSCGCYTLIKSGEFHRKHRIEIKCEKHKRRSKSRRRSRRRSSGRRANNIQDWIGFKEYMRNGMSNRSFIMLPRTKKLQIIREALRVVKHPKGRKNIQADLKYLQGSKRTRRFGYSHDMGPHIYNAHMQDGILLADNAFNWMGNPEARSENAGGG